MAGSITSAVSKASGGGGVVKYSITWTSDAAGAVTANTLDLVAGTLISVEFVPGAGGVQPTDLYDVTFLDAESVNVFDDGAGASVGANLSNVTSTRKLPMMGGGAVTYVRQWLHGGAYTPTVAAAGNAKQGTINVYVAPGVV